jgi:beta-carotene ketolase (CrtO type)
VYDVIVVGGGHNGLTCGAYLARAGKRVLVLERLPAVGGMAYTKEVPGAPGYLVSPCAVDFDFFAMPHSITDELELHRHGLELCAPDPWGSYVNREGGHVAFWRDLDRTAREIAYFSRRDAERYLELNGLLGDFFEVAMPYFQGHPRRPGARTIAEVIWRVVRTRPKLGEVARILAASPYQILEEWFEREEVRAPIAVLATLSMLPLDAPASNFGLLFAPFMHLWGLRRGVGGTGSLTRALAACIQARGGEVRSGARVQQILVRGGRAEGIVLEGGEELRATHVVAAVDPTTLLTGLLSEFSLPQRTREELRGMSVYDFNVSHFKADIALSQRPVLKSGGKTQPPELLNGVLLHAPSLADARAALGEFGRGRFHEHDPLMIVMPSAVDRTLVPPGSDGQVIYAWGVCPFEVADGEWATHRQRHVEKWIGICDSYAPGFKDSVIAADVQAPPDFITKYGAKGHLYHADLTLSQLGPWRPIPSLAGYRTPVEHLWHTGAGAHPMPGVNGWSGRSAARTVLKALK